MEPKKDIIILLRKTTGTEPKKKIKLIQKYGVSKAVVHKALTFLVFGWQI